MIYLRCVAVLIVGLLAIAATREAHAQTGGSDPGSVRIEATTLFQTKQYAQALQEQRLKAAEIEKEESESDGAPGARTAEALGSLAWYALFAREFEEARVASERAASIAPRLFWVQTNRAHALLLLGRTVEAREIFMAHKRQPVSGNSKAWELVIADDFQALKDAGIDHDEFESILAALDVVGARKQEELNQRIEKGTQLYWAKQYDAAEEWAKQTLAFAEAEFGAKSVSVAIVLNQLGIIHTYQARYEEAERANNQSLAIYEEVRGAENGDIVVPLKYLAHLYRVQGRLADEERLLKRSLAIAEKAFGPDSIDAGLALKELGRIAEAKREVGEAEALYQRAAGILQKSFDHFPDAAQTKESLALLYVRQSRYDDAEEYMRGALNLYENSRGPDHPDVGNALIRLAEISLDQGQLVDAEGMIRNGLRILEQELGPDTPEVAWGLASRGDIDLQLGRLAEAETAYERSLAILEKSGLPGDIQPALARLARLRRDQKRFGEARELFQKSLTIVETQRARDPGFDPRPEAALVRDMAMLSMDEGRFAEAEQQLQRSLSILETLASQHPMARDIYHLLATTHFAKREWELAASYWRKSTDLLLRRNERGHDDVGKSLTAKTISLPQRYSFEFWGLIRSSYRLWKLNPATRASVPRDMFMAAQWTLGSDIAISLAQMAARSAKGNAKLAELVRKRQDLVERWQGLEADTYASFAGDGRKRVFIDTLNSIGITAVNVQIASIDKQLAAMFPNYSEIVRPKPLSITEVQAELRPNEALVLILDTDASLEPKTEEETFIWVVTKTGFRWARSSLGRGALAREVAALRCGLDDTLWIDKAGEDRCRDLLKGSSSGNEVLPEGLPFDLARAHSLYKGLFEEVEDLIRSKELLAVASGPLTQLPLQVLITKAPSDKDYRKAAWLSRQHAVTVLPAVASLKALRNVASGSSAKKSMIGFGNPLLEGDPQVPMEVELAKIAREKQICPDLVQRVAGKNGARRNLQPVKAKDGRADLDFLRRQLPLPDTVEELCAVAKAFGLSNEDILLGAKAREAIIKNLNESNTLATYRIVHFATHGAIAGQVAGTNLPGLILTPPDSATDKDDGYLSSSEVAGLRLDADWVILSACNTAAGGSEDADALSGLARAFIYAGARALLVSHWAVNSAATVRLITSAVGATASDKKLGRAEALRRAMLGMIDKGELYEAHPAYWAPFVVVGEGGPSNERRTRQ
jgi:CHAT domain-containing protein/tetratricopeptide (TPR) repeat protein